MYASSPPAAQERRPAPAVEIELSQHCIDRFGEHFYPCFGREQIEREVDRLLSREAELVHVQPSWVKAPPNDPAVAWAVIGRDIALPLVPHDREHGVLVATTCLAAGSISHAERDRRRHRKAAARARKGRR